MARHHLLQVLRGVTLTRCILPRATFSHLRRGGCALVEARAVVVWHVVAAGVMKAVAQGHAGSEGGGVRP